MTIIRAIIITIALMMGTEMVPEMSVIFNELTWLRDQVDFSNENVSLICNGKTSDSFDCTCLEGKKCRGDKVSNT
jgi:hypothetical protein